jgi:hypothetical protein
MLRLVRTGESPTVKAADYSGSLPFGEAHYTPQSECNALCGTMNTMIWGTFEKLPPEQRADVIAWLQQMAKTLTTYDANLHRLAALSPELLAIELRDMEDAYVAQTQYDAPDAP